MAEDDLRCRFHLTYNGWKKGTRTFMGHAQGNVIYQPGDTLATYDLHIYQRSPWSKEERNWSRIWKSNEISDTKLKALEKKHP